MAFSTVGANIAGANDVALSSLSDKQVLTYSGVSAKWTNAVIPAGSGGSGSVPTQTVAQTWAAVIATPSADNTPVITMSSTSTISGPLIREKRQGNVSGADLDIEGDTHFRYDGAGSYIPHAANPTTMVYPKLVTDGAPQSARYTERISFVTDANNDEVELHLRHLQPNIDVRISVDGKWLTAWGEQYTPPSTIFDFKLKFPSAKSRTIMVEGTGTHWCWGGATVATGQTLTKTPEPAKRIVWVGDSYSGGSLKYPVGANRIETACNYVAKMMGCESFYHLGVGGTGWTTAGPFINRVQEALTYNPDYLVIDGSGNDATNPSAIQAAVEAALELAKDVPTVFVGGVHRGTASANNDAIKAATLGKGRIFLDYIAGQWFDSNTDLLPDNIHLTYTGHQKVARGLFADIQPHLQGQSSGGGGTSNLTIGTVTTGSPGTQADASITDGELNLTIPSGQPGVSSSGSGPLGQAVVQTGNQAGWDAAMTELLASKRYIGGDWVLTKELIIPANMNVTLTRPGSFFDSPTTGSAEILRGVRIRGAGRRSSTITFSSSASAGMDPRPQAMARLANRWRGATVEGLTIHSTNANQIGFYMWCAANSGQAPDQFPEYGRGAQNDIEWRDIEWSGSWKAGILTDGPQQYNQNSEQMFVRCSATNSTNFSRGMLALGYPRQDTWGGAHKYNVQQCQAVNYYFLQCNFEYSSGPVIYAAVGGSISIQGGSWINGIGAGDTGGPMIVMPSVDLVALDGVTPQNMPYDIKNLYCERTRFELRDSSSQVIDGSGWSGSSAKIAFQSIQVANNQIGDKANSPTMTFGNSGNGMPSVIIRSSELCGHIRFNNTSNPAANRNDLTISEGTSFREYNPDGGRPAPGLATSWSGDRAIRTRGGTVPVRFIGAYGAADAARVTPS